MMFQKISFLFCIYLQCYGAIVADQLKTRAKYLPIDVSFIIVDLKYNEERGAQICEVQHGVPSAFRGHAMLYEGKNLIAEHLLNGLSGYYEKSWAAIDSFADPSTKKLLKDDAHWSKVSSFKELEQTQEFLNYAVRPVKDPSDLSQYHGFVFMSPNTAIDREIFQKKYPGVVLIDNAFYNYADNKFKMTDLLMGHPLTEQHKPKWGLYQKNDENLADKIITEIGSDILVIKPTHEYLGKGVIILRKEELKSTLEHLFNNSRDFQDPAYTYWKDNKSRDFLVEEFIEVLPVSFPHLENKFYSPTLRLVYLLFYDKQEIHIKSLGGYYTLPKNSLCEEGSLNEQYKSCIRMPFFGKVDPVLREAAESDMYEVLKVIYMKLLNI